MKETSWVSSQNPYPPSWRLSFAEKLWVDSLACNPCRCNQGQGLETACITRCLKEHARVHPMLALEESTNKRAYSTQINNDLVHYVKRQSRQPGHHYVSTAWQFLPCLGRLGLVAPSSIKQRGGVLVSSDLGLHLPSTKVSDTSFPHPILIMAVHL